MPSDRSYYSQKRGGIVQNQYCICFALVLVAIMKPSLRFKWRSNSLGHVFVSKFVCVHLCVWMHMRACILCTCECVRLWVCVYMCVMCVYVCACKCDHVLCRCERSPLVGICSTRISPAATLSLRTELTMALTLTPWPPHLQLASHQRWGCSHCPACGARLLCVGAGQWVPHISLQLQCGVDSLGRQWGGLYCRRMAQRPSAY